MLKNEDSEGRKGKKQNKTDFIPEVKSSRNAVSFMPGT